MKPVLIRCDVENYSFMAFQKMDEIKQKGYESAEYVLNSLPAEYVKGLSENSNKK